MLLPCRGVHRTPAPSSEGGYERERYRLIYLHIKTKRRRLKACAVVIYILILIKPYIRRGVYAGIVYEHLIVQMVAGRVAGIANQRQQIALLNLCALSNL